MGLFNNLSQVQMFERSKYFKEGRYIVRISQCKFVEGGHKGDSLIIEAVVEGVFSSDPQAPQKGEVAAHAFSVSGTKRQQGLGNWMQFLTTTLKTKQEEHSDDQWDDITQKVVYNNALGGAQLYLECFESKSVKRATPENPEGVFTHHRWCGPPTERLLAEFGLVEE